MKRSFGVIISGVLFTGVIAGALSVSVLRLFQSKNAGSRPCAPHQIVSSNPTTSSGMFGIEHPGSVTPPAPMRTPAPQASEILKGSQSDVELPKELVRVKAEQARKKAEHTRAHVEGLYQKHRISEETYKKGQAEYHHELAKYGEQIAKYYGAAAGTGTINE